ncbi:MAG TPA: efflux RND transporter periplasmic adaptor subunit [candidate division Zixibacteria bacterium]|nr:efflux RND transporter periplasmic adaptor subunit [candidate division Zixibacteria bacterium]
MENKRKKWLWGGGVLLLLALAIPKVLSLQKSPGRTSGGGGGGGELFVQTLVVSPQRLEETVRAIGTLSANEEVEIRSERSGKIRKIYFREGSAVKAGDILVKIDDSELAAQLARAEQKRKLAEQLEERQKALLEKGGVSREEYDRILTELNTLKAEEQLIRVQVEKTEIKAPFDGTIGLRYGSEGSFVTSSDRLATLQDLGSLKIDFSIPEKYARQVKPGDKVVFTVTGTERKFGGSVFAVEPKVDPATRTLPVRAVASNLNRALVPGGFANVELVLRQEKALLLPAGAVIPDIKGHKVFLYQGGKAVSRDVEVGMRTSDQVEIASGLSLGDTVITTGLLQLRPGAAVRLSGEGAN